jgi:hypothetical protein
MSKETETIETKSHAPLSGVVVRLIYCLMIPTVIIGSVILLIPALVWWIFTGKDLMSWFVDWLNTITPNLP